MWRHCYATSPWLLLVRCFNVCWQSIHEKHNQISTTYSCYITTYQFHSRFLLKNITSMSMWINFHYERNVTIIILAINNRLWHNGNILMLVNIQGLLSPSLRMSLWWDISRCLEGMRRDVKIIYRFGICQSFAAAVFPLQFLIPQWILRSMIDCYRVWLALTSAIHMVCITSTYARCI